MSDSPPMAQQPASVRPYGGRLNIQAEISQEQARSYRHTPRVSRGRKHSGDRRSVMHGKSNPPHKPGGERSSNEPLAL